MLVTVVFKSGILRWYKTRTTTCKLHFPSSHTKQFASSGNTRVVVFACECVIETEPGRHRDETTKTSIHAEKWTTHFRGNPNAGVWGVNFASTTFYCILQKNIILQSLSHRRTIQLDGQLTHSRSRGACERFRIGVGLEESCFSYPVVPLCHSRAAALWTRQCFC